MATFVHSVEWIPIEMSHPPVHNRLIVHQLDSYRNRKLVTDSFQTPPEHRRESFSFFKQKKNSTIHQSAWRCQWQYDWHRNRLINQVEAIDYLLVGPFRRFERVKLVQSIDGDIESNSLIEHKQQQWINTLRPVTWSGPGITWPGDVTVLLIAHHQLRPPEKEAETSFFFTHWLLTSFFFLSSSSCFHAVFLSLLLLLLFLTGRLRDIFSSLVARKRRQPNNIQ